MVRGRTREALGRVRYSGRNGADKAAAWRPMSAFANPPRGAAEQPNPPRGGPFAPMSPATCQLWRPPMFKGGLLWLIGIPIPIILLLLLFGVL